MKESKVTVRPEEKGFLSILFDLFRSLKLTISLFILLAILSIIGTLITQNATRTEYIQRYGIRLYEVLNFFNLFDMYHSWWFSAILLLLVINLIACSVHRFPGVWSQISRGIGSTGLEDSMLKTLPYVEKVQMMSKAANKAAEEIQSLLKKRFGNPMRIETESAITLFSEKGKFSRLGVYITHLSLLIILIGGLMGSLYGFKGHVEILEGEAVNQIFLKTRDEEVSKPIDFSVRCDDFNITYYDFPGRKEKHVKEYTSALTILEDGKEVLKKTVQVNHPLHYKGLAFYQSSYGTLHDVTLGIQWKNKKEKQLLKTLEGEMVSIPNSDSRIQLLKYVPQVHNFGEGVQLVLFKPNQEPRVFWVLKDLPKFDPQNNNDFILTFEGVTSKEYTGLQVAKDPGVWIVWIGSGLMIFGLIVSFFFSHQRVWIRIPKSSDKEIILAGSANKNRVGFEKTFGHLIEGVRNTTKFQ
ncbi:MAG: cytochrome c biogenesis protein ResB [Desulfobacterales bacterium]|nr:cytochrome c biogenesis protein ResB [Desulfobacterales bacterium]